MGQKVQERPREIQKGPERPGRSRKVQKGPGRSRKVQEDPGRSRKRKGIEREGQGRGKGRSRSVRGMSERVIGHLGCPLKAISHIRLLLRRELEHKTSRSLKFEV